MIWCYGIKNVSLQIRKSCLNLWGKPQQVRAFWMSLNRYLKSHTLQFYSVYQSDTAFLIILCKDNANREQNHQACLYVMPRCRLSYCKDNANWHNYKIKICQLSHKFSSIHFVKCYFSVKMPCPVTFLTPLFHVFSSIFFC